MEGLRCPWRTVTQWREQTIFLRHPRRPAEAWPSSPHPRLAAQGQARDSTQAGAHQKDAGVPAGRWMGRGLPALGLALGQEVTKAQLRSLFGEGWHSHADRIEAAQLGQRERSLQTCAGPGRSASQVVHPPRGVRAARPGREEGPVREGPHT
ncbi:relaxase domain-containing protein [Streptomyces sp. NPDC058451]|uniref:relaxase domain-containing protein n=1 Tax=Streptomyces sp. NPDC058451 TaxID=3346506 RepID=UPI003668A77D